jgi:hypothetical protein
MATSAVVGSIVGDPVAAGAAVVGESIAGAIEDLIAAGIGDEVGDGVGVDGLTLPAQPVGQASTTRATTRRATWDMAGHSLRLPSHG